MLFVGAGTLNTPYVAGAETIRMQALLNPDGSGHLFVNTGAGEPFSWEACAPDLSICTPFTVGREISTVGAQPDTVFRVSNASDTATGVSPVWRGNLVSLAPPSISGVLRANELVTPIPGQWRGGWDGAKDWMQLAACTTPTAIRCTTLTHSHYAEGCRNDAAVLDPAFTGDYLRVADENVGAGPHFILQYGVGSPYGFEIWKPGPTTATALAGRIRRAAGPRTAKCGPPPVNEASISRQGVAVVRCGLGCHAVLIAKNGRRKAHVFRKVRRGRSFQYRPIVLTLPRRARARLEPGRTRLIVRINGRRVARRTVSLR